MHFAFVNFKHDFGITSDQLATFSFFQVECSLNFVYNLLSKFYVQSFIINHSPYETLDTVKILTNVD